VKSFWVFDFSDSVSLRLRCVMRSDWWEYFSGEREGVAWGGWLAGGRSDRFQRLMLSA
jgi:hypothetical protein